MEKQEQRKERAVSRLIRFVRKHWPSTLKSYGATVCCDALFGHFRQFPHDPYCIDRIVVGGVGVICLVAGYRVKPKIDLVG